MKAPNGFHVRFLLGTNLPVSVSRITADTANHFVRQGVSTTVMFPSVDWWEYRRFMLGGLPPLSRVKAAVLLAAQSAGSALFRKEWCGLSDWKVDPRVRFSRFGTAPPLAGLEGGITVAQHTYVVARALREPRGRPGLKMVGAIHVNLEKAMECPSPEGAAWFRHWVGLERELKIPRYATSEESRRAAERLGIPVRKMIHGGIDLELFRPSPARQEERVTVSVYCDPNKQKGRSVGVEAAQGLKAALPEVKLCSIGHVTPGQAAVFDRNHGYLKGDDYVKALQESDVLIYPSLYDGFPAPPLQAMACGAALVTTAVEGVVEYAKDGVNCLLCPPGDAAALKAQAARLAADASLRLRLREEGFRTARDFSAERSCAELLSFLREVYAEETA